MNTIIKQRNNLGSVLRSFRIAREFSTKELADKMNVRPSYISDVEHGLRMPSRDTYEKYSEALNIPCSVIEFFNEEVTKHGYTFRKLLIAILQHVDKLEDKKGKESGRMLVQKDKRVLKEKG